MGERTLIKLELMDWKKLEKDAEEAMRQALMVVECHKCTLRKARQKIGFFESKQNE